MRWWWWPVGVGIVLLVLATVVGGPLLLGFGIKSVVDNQHFLDSARPAIGVVVGRVERPVDLPELTANRGYPVVRFVSASGEVVRFVAGPHTNPPSFHVGGTVRLLYDPAHPRQVRFNTWLDRLGNGILEVAFGLYLTAMVVAIGYWIFRDDRRHRSPRRGH